MKKYVGFILLSLFCICLLFGCGSQDDAKSGKGEETTTVDQIEMTESSITTTQGITTAETLQTTTLKTVKLDNKLQGSYRVKDFVLSAPAYFDTKEEGEDTITLTRNGIGSFVFLAFDYPEDNFFYDKDEIEEICVEDFTKKFDDLEKKETKSAYFGVDKCNYSIYTCKKADTNVRILLTLYYDVISQNVYYVCFAYNDIFTHDFETDYLNILKNIKWINPKSENKDESSLKINQTFLSNDWSGNTVLVVEYTWTNTTDKTTSFIFGVSTKCFQNGVECEEALFCDDVGSGDSMKEVMPGSSITLRRAYEIKDMSEVTLQCSKFLSPTPFLETTIKLS